MRKERPIIIPRPEMVQAILEDRKTQHRWPIKPQPDNNTPVYWDKECQCWKQDYIDGHAYTGGPSILAADSFECPYQLGGILWVREKFKVANCVHLAYEPRGSAIIYEDGSCILIPEEKLEWYYQHFDALKWRSPIFMPKWASRIKLEVTNIWVEQVQSISEEDAIAEGVNGALFADDGSPDYILAFRHLWDSIWAKKGFGWDQNPWVWVIEFRRCDLRVTGFKS